MSLTKQSKVFQLHIILIELKMHLENIYMINFHVKWIFI